MSENIRQRIDRLFKLSGAEVFEEITAEANLRAALLDGLARAFWVDAFLTEVDSRGVQMRGQLEAQVPPTPQAPREAAEKVLAETERLSEASALDLLRRAKEADGEDPEGIDRDYAWNFGWYLGMAVMGSGVSWFDDHARFPLKEPYEPYYLTSDEEEALVRQFIANHLRDQIPD